MTSLPNVSELVPHDAPMIVLDEVVTWDSPRVTCRATLRSESPFVSGTGMPGHGLIEYLAQAIGCCASLMARARVDGQEHVRPKVGFVLGSREIDILCDSIPVGATIEVHADHVFGDQRLGSFKSAAYVDGELVAAGTINVFASQGLEDLP